MDFACDVTSIQPSVFRDAFHKRSDNGRKEKTIDDVPFLGDIKQERVFILGIGDKNHSCVLLSHFLTEFCQEFLILRHGNEY